MPSTPLFDPERFFAERTPSLLGAAAVVYAIGVVSVASGVPLFEQAVGSDASAGLVVVAVLLGGAVGAAGIWALFTAVVYVLSGLLGGSGSLARTAANVGWGQLPNLLASAVATGAIWFLYLTGGLPSITPTHGQLPLWVVLLQVTANVAGYLWVGYLFAYGIREARNLTLRRAAVVAGVVSVGSIVFSLSSLL
ncbi:YIP1 family protein [Halogeometricum luteum]|uniref:YIP1 family protein n=1 Tax=Halogeometricum luteum TaxID=2950537 RepID=A0ABU2G4F7_9EURY|nr:YIP1 family protein [Halogeometricum sp. S3BR5-2]MDS0295682.1 YIP1 family protein [Halogeometricum sp. S3BR5-2]